MSFNQETIFVISKYFNTRQDYISLAKTNKEYNIIDKYKYNPINDITIFKNIETYHIYEHSLNETEQEYETTEKYFNFMNNISIDDLENKYIIDWRPTKYSTIKFLNIMSKYITFKNIILDIPINPIPKHINLIDEYCFHSSRYKKYLNNNDDNKEIIIPNEINLSKSSFNWYK